MRAMLSLALVGLALAGCSDLSQPTDFADGIDPTGTAARSVQTLPGWSQEDVAGAIPPLLAACPHLGSLWRGVCVEAQGVPPGDEASARDFVERNFRAVPMGAGLFTGYFELEVPGSRNRGGPYQFPLLRPPPRTTHLDRTSIQQGALAGEGLEIAWLTSPADVYFLQLQGSGSIRLPNGRVVRVGYAGNNGRPPLGTERLFRTAGIPHNDLSIPAIRAWIAAHPAQGAARLNCDPSYVFFQETRDPSGSGHRGALGTPLVPLRSVAVGPALRAVPLGSPVWLDGTDRLTGQRLPRLMLASDTGDTIQGPARMDIYYGWGQGAETQGGHIHTTGHAWVLRPANTAILAALPKPPRVFLAANPG